MEHEVFHRSQDLCRQVGLPSITVTNLFRYLIVKKLVSTDMQTRMFPSAEADKLQRSILLETNLRNLVESILGEIRYSALEAEFEAVERAARKCLSWNALRHHGFEVDLDEWMSWPGKEDCQQHRMGTAPEDRKFMDHETLLKLCNLSTKMQLPDHTDSELMRFLIVKRLVGMDTSARMSPSANIDELQHAVLLDTDLRKEVEAIVGEIQHSTVTAELPEREKAKRRLLSMDAMYYHGWEPSLQVWQEPGTILHRITFDVYTANGIEEECRTYRTVPYGGDIIQLPGSHCRLKRKRPLSSPAKPDAHSSLDSIPKGRSETATVRFQGVREVKIQWCRGAGLRIGHLYQALKEAQYIASDDMCITDSDGRRVHLWELLDSCFGQDPEDNRLDMLYPQRGC